MSLHLSLLVSAPLTEQHLAQGRGPALVSLQTLMGLYWGHIQIKWLAVGGGGGPQPHVCGRGTPTPAWWSQDRCAEPEGSWPLAPAV